MKGVIFSSMAPLTQPEEWFSNLSNQFQTLEMVQPIALELTTNRAGNQGNLADDLSIEQMEKINLTAEQNGFQFASLFLPIQIETEEKTSGLELSNCNGWVDLASYLGFNQVRVRVQNLTTPLSNQFQDVLFELLQYIQESGLTASLSFARDDESNAQTVIEHYNHAHRSAVGQDVIIPFAGFDKLEFEAAQDRTITSIFIPIGMIPNAHQLDTLTSQIHRLIAEQNFSIVIGID
ncbi:MAG: hypothetical protein ACOX5R_20250 [bacterium]